MKKILAILGLTTMTIMATVVPANAALLKANDMGRAKIIKYTSENCIGSIRGIRRVGALLLIG